ncbi:MAG: hypothetical protein ACOX40_06030 [Bacilli bacterium]|jgi:hypothetical protein
MKKNISKEIPDPLMFIHTVSTKISETKAQDYYDSSEHPQEKKIEPKYQKEHDELDEFLETLEEEEFEETEPTNENVIDPDLIERHLPLEDMLRVKLENIITMYHNGRPVECTLITETEEINCYPYEIKDDHLIVKTDDEEDLTINLKDLLDIYIIKF